MSKGLTHKDAQTAYWDRVAEHKTFSHPVDWERFSALVPRQARILDYGCGYGRTVVALHRRGYQNVTGVDSSSGMIDRGRREHPEANLYVVQAASLPFEDATFDVALLFSVLTCIPSDDDQRAVVQELGRILKPGGLLYISDLPLQADERNRKRYAKFAETFGTYGIFALPEGVVCRHHDPAWIDRLTADFDRLHQTRMAVQTMNGHSVTAFQVWLANTPSVSADASTWT